MIFETHGLALACTDHALADLLAAFGFAGGRDLVEGDRRYFYVQVDAVEERAADFVEVFLNYAGATDAVFVGMVIIAAWARVHAGNQHKVGGELNCHFRP
ncbi:hypothetical protein D3C86_1705550 [compost metagenome]